MVARIEVQRQLFVQNEEIKSAHTKQQVSESTHDAEMIHYIDWATIKKVKPKITRNVSSEFGKG